jgi:hypothetical protein
VCESSEAMLEETLQVLRTVASMSRNLPTSTTLLLTGRDADSDGNSERCSVAPNTDMQGCSHANSGPHVVPASLRLLFKLAQTHAQCMSKDGMAHRGSLEHKAHASISKVAMGLLSDLAANDEEVRKLLQERHASAVTRPSAGVQIWEAAELWSGVCADCSVCPKTYLLCMRAAGATVQFCTLLKCHQAAILSTAAPCSCHASAPV